MRASPLADSHVHFDRYPPADVEAMLTRARQAGVRHFLAVGVEAGSSDSAVELAQREPDVLAAIGVHPKAVGSATTVGNVRELAQQPCVAAIGEVGLDDSVGPEHLPAQIAFFGNCLDLAAELDKAVALHVVGAHRQAREMLAGHRTLRTVVHYFQGDVELARRYLDLGCHISVGKPVTRPDRAELREAVRQVPLDRLLLETDTYPLPGRTTEPRHVVDVCRAVAELHGVTFEEVAEATTASYLRLFGG